MTKIKQIASIKVDGVVKSQEPLFSKHLPLTKEFKIKKGYPPLVHLFFVCFVSEWYSFLITDIVQYINISKNLPYFQQA